MKSLHSTWLLVPSTHRVLPSCAHSAYPDMWGSETQIDITSHLLSFNFFQKPRKTNNYLLIYLHWNQLTWLLKQTETVLHSLEARCDSSMIIILKSKIDKYGGVASIKETLWQISLVLAIYDKKMSIFGSKVTKKLTFLPTPIVSDILCSFLNR